MFPRSSTFARRAAVALACGVGAATVIGLFAGNARTVPAGSEAVVMAFGRIRRVQNAGLVVAWPAPAGRIVLVPSENRPVTTSLAVPGLSLTGDGGAVRISANVAWRVADARAYATAGLDAAPVLQRVFEATAVEIAAGRSGDALLGAAHGGTETASSRALNTTMTTALNRRLLALR
jgi:membrane protease subunit HflK